MQPTLSKNVHGIVDLNVHVIADGCQFVFLGGYSLTVLALDLPRRTAFFREATSDENALAVFFGLVGFFALILDRDRHLRHPKDV